MVGFEYDEHDEECEGVDRESPRRRQRSTYDKDKLAITLPHEVARAVRARVRAGDAASVVVAARAVGGSIATGDPEYLHHLDPGVDLVSV